ncbi:MAG TPA: protein kinase [Blastocatellia bacterium]|nr:protein kinase [Blastocatellia bacterium]
MDAKLWGQIKDIYDRALDLRDEEREDFLAEACGDDGDLRNEVESLLAAHEDAGAFLQSPAVEVAAREIVADELTSPAPQLIGRELANYKIISLLGRGGMGEIYLAEDKRLHRKVALKLLAPQFTNDADRVRRFDREARAVSALNHPNIVTIFDIGQAGGLWFMATEFIEGRTLRQVLTESGALRLPEVFRIAGQIADALQAAHDVGIIHRDIKPDNVMLRPDGYVKTLDFGLAKVNEKISKSEPSGESLSSLTEAGAVMGTVSYMSPEQARGLNVDKRTDIFSLGVVIYEMITGRLPFEGATASDVIASLLRSDQPPLARYSPEAPDDLEQIVAKALAKKQEERYQSVKDLILDLKSLAQRMELTTMLARGGGPGPKSVKEGATRHMSPDNEDRQSAPISTQLTCPGCKSINPGLARFCLNCGGSLFTHCVNCRTETPPGARFCMSCGQQVGGVTPADNARQAHLAAATPSSLANKIREAVRPISEMTHERRVVTALLADLSVSDASGRRIDPEDWSEVLNRALDRLSAVIYHYEGAIALLMGNSMLAFFGAPVAHEDDPARAVRAALDMLNEARKLDAELRRERDIELDARVGINTGTVILGNVSSDLKFEFTVMGDTVNLAAIAQSAARPMSAVFTENTWRRVAPVFDCVEFGSLEVKGRAELVRAYEARGSRTETTRAHGVAGLESPMVGRDAELTALMRLSAAARAGVGRVAVVIGEPGLGKTRLITEWKTADGGSGGNDETGLQWATGRALSYGQNHAYHLLVSLLRSLLGVSATADEAELRRALSLGAERLLGNSAMEVYPYLGHLLSLRIEESALKSLRRLNPQALQSQYLMALRRLVQAMASERPLALMLEDIHWADPSSIELLIKLMPLASESPVLFCFVTRPESSAAGWKLVTTARDVMGARLTEMTIKELSESDSQQLVFNLLGVQPLSDQMRSLILKKAEGNPFFVEEVLRMLIDQGALVKSGDQWTVSGEVADVEIPDNLQGLLMARIDRLPDEAKQILRVASVIGRQFSVKVLEQVLEKTR